MLAGNRQSFEIGWGFVGTQIPIVAPRRVMGTAITHQNGRQIRMAPAVLDGNAYWSCTIRTNGTSSMPRLSVSKAQEEFPEVVNRAAYGKERTIVSRRGKDLAAVIPIEDLHLLERLAQEEMDRQDLADAKAALKEAEEKGTIPLKEAKKQLGL
jgi:prevent-host-death family protein